MVKFHFRTLILLSFSAYFWSVWFYFGSFWDAVKTSHDRNRNVFVIDNLTNNNYNLTRFLETDQEISKKPKTKKKSKWATKHRNPSIPTYLCQAPYFMDQSLVILGMVKDAEDVISKLLFQLESVSCLFKNTIFFIFESNSEDSTPNLLKKWSRNTTSFQCDWYKWHMSDKECINVNNNEQQQMQINNHMANINKIILNDSWNSMADYNDSTPRIHKYIHLRNFLLKYISNYLKEQKTNFNQIMMVDFDTISFDATKFINSWHELQYGAKNMIVNNNNVLCIRGVQNDPYNHDVFATVLLNGTWTWPNWRHWRRYSPPRHSKKKYFQVQSCFGGLSVYSNIDNYLIRSNCKYQRSATLWKRNENEMNLSNKIINQLKEYYDWFDKQAIFKENGDICEHLPYHFCLQQNNYSFYISTKSKLYHLTRKEEIIKRNV